MTGVTEGREYIFNLGESHADAMIRITPDRVVIDAPGSVVVKCKSCKWIRSAKSKKLAKEKAEKHTRKSEHSWFRFDFTQ